MFYAVFNSYNYHSILSTGLQTNKYGINNDSFKAHQKYNNILVTEQLRTFTWSESVVYRLHLEKVKVHFTQTENGYTEKWTSVLSCFCMWCIVGYAIRLPIIPASSWMLRYMRATNWIGCLRPLASTHFLCINYIAVSRSSNPASYTQHYVFHNCSNLLGLHEKKFRNKYSFSHTQTRNYL